MISLSDVYHVVAATVPLYVAMMLAYISVKWWKFFTAEQCSGINKFVAKFSIPLLSFQVISDNNLYKMNLQLILADFLQKILAIVLLGAITKITSRGGLHWIITGLSLSTMPNTLILGLPVLKAMYGTEADVLLAQIVVLQSILWYNILLFLFEFTTTKAASLAPASEATEIDITQEERAKEEIEEARDRSRRSLKTRTILLTVARKLISNPNTHATILGLIWASIRFRWGVKLPEVIDRSITILSTGGLGMAMFSLGLFMGSRSSIIACGTKMTLVAMGMKFLIGPALMAACSFPLGLRGRLLKVAIVQAALPQGIVPFVFAKEYNIHPDVLSTGVLLGLLIALPVALVYYYLMSL
ncbi:auxin efflux carrier component 8-like [Cucurbita pepo subsp. pepo]|uniref:Auxin efflux carrier component n=2 Tax=Cucurbita TaxID=3660 RepID=A0A6J1F1R0_CUCMO|nr:auxin efflux carrier component 8 [Cucurbita moschata]XP_023527301.1 auxin efflux carrier component 8-like [Cucurbita pepo subsp. pepo]